MKGQYFYLLIATFSLLSLSCLRDLSKGLEPVEVKYKMIMGSDTIFANLIITGITGNYHKLMLSLENKSFGDFSDTEDYKFLGELPVAMKVVNSKLEIYGDGDLKFPEDSLFWFPIVHNELYGARLRAFIDKEKELTVIGYP